MMECGLATASASSFGNLEYMLSGDIDLCTFSHVRGSQTCSYNEGDFYHSASLSRGSGTREACH